MDCGRSLEKLNKAIEEIDVDAVVASEGSITSDHFRTIASLPGSIPRILFESTKGKLGSPFFNLRIPHQTGMLEWRSRVIEVISRGKSLRAETISLSSKSSVLREQAITLVQAITAVGRSTPTQSQAPSVGIRRVLIVEDHREWRRAIHSLLKEHLEIQLLEEAIDGTEAIRVAEVFQPDRWTSVFPDSVASRSQDW